MPDRPEPLDLALADLGGALAYPRPAADFASQIIARIQAAPPVSESALERWRRWLAAPSGARPIRRSLLIAVALLLIGATVATAIGLGLPGIRIIFGPPASGSPVPSRSVDASGPIGSSLGIGIPMALADAARVAGVEPRLPTAAGIGPPDQAFFDGGRLTMVWAARVDLPETEAPGIGLLLTEFRGTVDTGFFEKLVNGGQATVEEVRVNGRLAYWLSGDPHLLVYRLPGGGYVEDTRRMVGDVLIWRDDELTYRLETSLGRDEAIRIAESIPVTP